MWASKLARTEHYLRPILASVIPPKTAVHLYSSGRSLFLSQFFNELPPNYAPPARLRQVLWGLEFRSPLLNGSGMFKNGEGYSLTAAEGAGAYLAGTTTALPRSGNVKNGISLPFVPYPRSSASSNWLGLPNDGDAAVAERLSKLRKTPGCPIGVSISGAPELSPDERLVKLLEGLRGYEAAGVDFIELNESCPNTEAGAEAEDAFAQRLQKIREGFLSLRRRMLPVIVKFSPDTELARLPLLMDLLVGAGFDGVNFGNTSTSYASMRQHIAPAEQSLYDYFTTTFGGGIGGAPLRAPTLELVKRAHSYLTAHPPGREFHIVRTGGVATAQDVVESLQAGASLVQWFTGFFEAFAHAGHGLYRTLFEQLPADIDAIVTRANGDERVRTAL